MGGIGRSIWGGWGMSEWRLMSLMRRKESCKGTVAGVRLRESEDPAAFANKTLDSRFRGNDELGDCASRTFAVVVMRGPYLLWPIPTCRGGEQTS